MLLLGESSRLECQGSALPPSFSSSAHTQTLQSSSWVPLLNLIVWHLHLVWTNLTYTKQAVGTCVPGTLKDSLNQLQFTDQQTQRFTDRHRFEHLKATQLTIFHQSPIKLGSGGQPSSHWVRGCCPALSSQSPPHIEGQFSISNTSK